jgi:hypothetical protein
MLSGAKVLAAELSADLPQGLEVYGFFRAETGVGQAARGIVQAMRQAAAPFSCHTLSVDGFANDIASMM